MTDLENPEPRWLEWVETASAAVGVDPASVDIVEIHHLSKEVAHRLERPLAPVSTFILGLALGAGAAGATDSSAGTVAASERQRLLDALLATLPDA